MMDGSNLKLDAMTSIVLTSFRRRVHLTGPRCGGGRDEDQRKNDPYHERLLMESATSGSAQVAILRIRLT
jgi:hypothetical protein